MMKKTLIVGLVGGVASVALPALAHHSISDAYCTDQQTRIEGTVVEFNYRNPHAFVSLDDKDPATGQPVRWGVEWASVKRLERENIQRDTIKPGDHLEILGNPARKAEDKTLHMVGVARPSDGWKWGRKTD